MDAVTFPLAFAAGVAAFASPCFLPVVPVFITYLLGGQADPQAQAPSLALAGSSGSGGLLYQPGAHVSGGSGRGGSEGSLGESLGQTQVAARVPPTQEASAGQTISSKRNAAAANSLAFVAAFTLVFMGLWALIAAIGWVVGDYRELLRVVGGIVLVVLGLFTVGLLRVPSLEGNLGLNRNLNLGKTPTVGRSALLGVAFSAGWTPCISPVLGVILGLAMTSGSMATGLGLLAAFSLGLGVPFVLVAVGATSLTSRLSWLSRHYRAIQLVSGALLLAMGLLMITDLWSVLAGLSWFSV